MMTAELIDKILRDPRGASTLTEEALLSLAELSVSVLRMIDARRERGIAFESSYNEQELRRALASMAAQQFPPGPPMTGPTAELEAAYRAAVRRVSQQPDFGEAHDFQRFEHRSRGYTDGRTVRQLKIVCRCGWAADWIDLEPDGDVGRSAARDLLAMHVTEAIDHAQSRLERNP